MSCQRQARILAPRPNQSCKFGAQRQECLHAPWRARCRDAPAPTKHRCPENSAIPNLWPHQASTRSQFIKESRSQGRLSSQGRIMDQPCPNAPRALYCLHPDPPKRLEQMDRLLARLSAILAGYFQAPFQRFLELGIHRCPFLLPLGLKI